MLIGQINPSACSVSLSHTHTHTHTLTHTDTHTQSPYGQTKAQGSQFGKADSTKGD